MSRGLIILALFPIGFWYAGETFLMWYGIVLFAVSFGLNVRRFYKNNPDEARWLRMVLGTNCFTAPKAEPINLEKYEPYQWR